MPVIYRNAVWQSISMKRKRFHGEIFGLDVICSFLGCVFLVLFYLGDFFLLKLAFPIDKQVKAVMGGEEL